MSLLPVPPGNNTCTTKACPSGHTPIIKGGCTTECIEIEMSGKDQKSPDTLHTLINTDLSFSVPGGLKTSQIAALTVNNCYDDRGVGHKNNFYGGYIARKVGRVMRYNTNVTRQPPNTPCYCCK